MGGKEVRVVVAGGGTGGHLFPGLAIAKEMEKRREGANILFVVGRRKMESEILSRSGYRQEMIHVEGIKGRGWKKMAAVLLKLPYSFFQSVSILRKFSPHLVIGVGGYSAGPVCLAAWLMGIPTAIQEQNSFPGVTNRLLCRFVDRVFISFEESREHFPAGTLHLTGNPVRESLLTEKRDPSQLSEKFTILAVGGSQGARAINEAFLHAQEILKSKGRDFHVVHQTGKNDYERVEAEYRRTGLKGDITPFIDDMAVAYNRADIVVSRAGATTVSELAALGKPSVLIPYPFAANRHQEINARVLQEAGGADLILQEDLSGERLADFLMKYMDDRDALVEMGRLAGEKGRPNAAQLIGDHLIEMIHQ